MSEIKTVSGRLF